MYFRLNRDVVKFVGLWMGVGSGHWVFTSFESNPFYFNLQGILISAISLMSIGAFLRKPKFKAWNFSLFLFAVLGSFSVGLNTVELPYNRFVLLYWGFAYFSTVFIVERIVLDSNEVTLINLLLTLSLIYVTLQLYLYRDFIGYNMYTDAEGSSIYRSLSRSSGIARFLLLLFMYFLFSTVRWRWLIIIPTAYFLVIIQNRTSLAIGFLFFLFRYRKIMAFPGIITMIFFVNNLQSLFSYWSRGDSNDVLLGGNGRFDLFGEIFLNASWINILFGGGWFYDRHLLGNSGHNWINQSLTTAGLIGMLLIAIYLVRSVYRVVFVLNNDSMKQMTPIAAVALAFSLRSFFEPTLTIFGFDTLILLSFLTIINARYFNIRRNTDV